MLVAEDEAAALGVRTRDAALGVGAGGLRHAELRELLAGEPRGGEASGGGEFSLGGPGRCRREGRGARAARLELVGADGEEGVRLAGGGAGADDVLERPLGLDLRGIDAPASKPGATVRQAASRRKSRYTPRATPEEGNAARTVHRAERRPGRRGAPSRSGLRVRAGGRRTLAA